MNLEALINVVQSCTSEGHVLVVGVDGERPYLQVLGRGGNGRKWFLSHHMTESEVVQTALAAVLAFVEHEAREGFEWHGRKIFGPHFDVKQLWYCAGKDNTRALRKEEAS